MNEVLAAQVPKRLLGVYAINFVETVDRIYTKSKRLFQSDIEAKMSRK